jgi:hypothetical protein
LKSRRKDDSASQNQPQAGFAFFWNIVFLVLGMLVMLLIQPLLRSTTQVRPRPASTEAPSAQIANNPWGTFEYVHFTLEQPDTYLPDSERKLVTPRWFFEGYSQDQLLEFLNSAGLTAEQKTRLMNPGQWEMSANGIYVCPSRDVIRSLSRPSRQKVYSVLGQSNVNLAHRYPFRCRVDGFEQWFERSNLSQEKLDLVRNLTVTNGQSLGLVDIDLVQDALTPEEFKGVFRRLYSEPSLLALLKVARGEEVSRLIKYWGRNGRENSVAPILKSLAKDGGTLNVSQLLPPFARLRLYTFVPPTDGSNGPQEDCFWAAMNFFNEKPDPSLLNLQTAIQRLKTDYVSTPEKALGDILVLLDKSNRTLHACVYIADDVVFTKNGTDYMEPFVLMKMRDVLAKYETEGGLHVATLRSKKLIPQ